MTPDRAGHGLTYGQIAYSDFRQSAASIRSGATIELVATITNTSSRAATEVVQLYLRDPVASIVQPVQELKGYQRIDLAPGTSRQVTFHLSTEDLAFIGQDNRPVIEPGEFRVWIAPSAEAEGVAGKFTLLG